MVSMGSHLYNILYILYNWANSALFPNKTEAPKSASPHQASRIVTKTVKAAAVSALQRAANARPVDLAFSCGAAQAHAHVRPRKALHVKRSTAAGAMRSLPEQSAPVAQLIAPPTRPRTSANLPVPAYPATCTKQSSRRPTGPIAAQASKALLQASRQLLRNSRAAARKAAEEKAKLQAEAAVLRYELGNATQELARLQDIEGLADDALSALEAQTREATRLRAHMAGLEEALATARNGSELEQVRSDLAAAKRDLEAAQEEAERQEDDAELAKGELDEFRRHMAREVAYAREQARQLLLAEFGDVGQLQKEAERAAANAAEARQERDSLRAMLAASSAKEADLKEQVNWLQLDLQIQEGSMTSLEERVALLEAEQPGLIAAMEAAEKRAWALHLEVGLF